MLGLTLFRRVRYRKLRGSSARHAGRRPHQVNDKPDEASRTSTGRPPPGPEASPTRRSDAPVRPVGSGPSTLAASSPLGPDRPTRPTARCPHRATRPRRFVARRHPAAPRPTPHGRRAVDAVGVATAGRTQQPGMARDQGRRSGTEARPSSSRNATLPAARLVARAGPPPRWPGAARSRRSPAQQQDDTQHRQYGERTDHDPAAAGQPHRCRRHTLAGSCPADRAGPPGPAPHGTGPPRTGPSRTSSPRSGPPGTTRVTRSGRAAPARSDDTLP